MMDKNILEEYNAIKTSAGYFDFSIEGKIIVNGSGRVDFINGLVSNDVKNLKENNGVYGAFLDKLGKILSDCIIYKFKDFLLINLSIIGKNNVIQRLKDEALLGKSIVDDITLKFALFSVQGAGSNKIVKEITGCNSELKNQYDCTINNISMKENHNNLNKKSKLNFNENKNNGENEIMVAKNKRTAYDGYDLYVPAALYGEFKEKLADLGIKQIFNETYNILRLEAKIPLFGIDFNEKNILNEVAEKAISYEKGCFVGQEIVARIKNIAKGLTAKKLMFLEIESVEIPEKNAKIMKDGKEAGFITSAAFSPEKNKVIGFGFLYKEFYGTGGDFEVVINNKRSICKANPL